MNSWHNINLQLLDNDVNLESLRNDLVSQIALLLIVCSSFITWLLLIVEPYPLILTGFWGIHFLAGLAIIKLKQDHPLRARLILLTICNFSVLIAMVLFSAEWIPFISMPLILANAILFKRSEWFTTSITLACIFIMSQQGYRNYPTVALYIAIISAFALSVIVRRALHRTIDWTWMLGQKSVDLLEVARDRQGELNRTVKALREANEKLIIIQSALVSAQQEAEAAKRAKEQFAANISHELRTPLNIIVGFSEVLFFSPRVYGKSDWPPALRTDIAHIYHNSYHLANMINDVLDLSRLNKSEFSLSLELYSVQELVDSAVSILQEAFIASRITVHKRIDDTMPDLLVDMTRIRQVLINLLTNAINFSEPDSHIYIDVKYDALTASFIFAIRDEGIGIDPQNHQYIFDEFYQVDSKLSKKHQGAGLGLAISKQLIEAHKGKIWVKSALGQGATFFFSLPTNENYAFLPAYVAPEHTHSVKQKLPIVLIYDHNKQVYNQLVGQNPKIDFIYMAEAEHWQRHCERYHPQAILFNANMQSVLPDANLTTIPVIEYRFDNHHWLGRFLSVHKCLSKLVTAQELKSTFEEIGYIRKVVIIDDNRGFCQLVERMLQSFGQDFQIKHAYDRERGLNLIAHIRPDVIILDLPIVDDNEGFLLLDTLRRTPALSTIPVIIISSFNLEDEMQQYEESHISINLPYQASSKQLTGLLASILDYTRSAD